MKNNDVWGTKSVVLAQGGVKIVVERFIDLVTYSSELFKFVGSRNRIRMLLLLLFWGFRTLRLRGHVAPTDPNALMLCFFFRSFLQCFSYETSAIFRNR